jgi:hypothetical protein
LEDEAAKKSHDVFVKTTVKPSSHIAATDRSGSWRVGTTSVLTDRSAERGSLARPLWEASMTEWSAKRTGVRSVVGCSTAEMSGVIDMEHPESMFASPEPNRLREADKEATALPAVTSSSEPE